MVNNQELADTFNKFFSDVGIDLQKDIQSGETRPTHNFAHPPIFEFKEFDLLTVTNVIRELSPSSSCGTDGITSRLLKLVGPIIVLIIQHICNLSARAFQRSGKH